MWGDDQWELLEEQWPRVFKRGGGRKFWEQTCSLPGVHRSPFLFQLSAHLLLPSHTRTDSTCFHFVVSLSGWLWHSRCWPINIQSTQLCLYKSFRFSFSDCCSDSWAQLFWLRLMSLRWATAADVWWVDLGWPPASLSLPSTSKMGEENKMKSSHVSRWGQRDHSPIWPSQANGLNLIYCQLIYCKLVVSEQDS